MRLTLIALAFRKTSPGHRFRGKRRVWPTPTEVSIENKLKWLQLEEQNMFLLRNPYLTLDQSWGHAKELGKKKEFITERRLEKLRSTTKPDVTVEERYNMLRTTDVWD